MNTVFRMKYLTGGDKFYGPNFGAATVSTQVRKGYLQECPNVATPVEQSGLSTSSSRTAAWAT